MKTTIMKNGKLTVVPDYAKVQGMLLGGIAAFVIFITVIGPECVSFPSPHQCCGILILCFLIQEPWVEL